MLYDIATLVTAALTVAMLAALLMLFAE